MNGQRRQEWVGETGMLQDIQGDFRRGRRTEDNLYMLERIIEMSRGRGGGQLQPLYVAFIDIGKAYD